MQELHNVAGFAQRTRPVQKVTHQSQNRLSGHNKHCPFRFWPVGKLCVELF